MDQVALDRKIKIARVDYDIAAYKASIADESRKLLELLLSQMKIDERISELNEKIRGKEAEKETL
jgi:hypothetical protein